VDSAELVKKYSAALAKQVLEQIEAATWAESWTAARLA